MGISEPVDFWKIGPGTDLDRELTPAVRALLRGGVIVYPTETLYGLGAFPFSTIAVNQVYAVKQRQRHKPLPLIADRPEAVRQVTGAWPEAAERLAAAFWPGPLSLILDAGDELPPAITAGTGQIAVRVSSQPIARALAARLGGLMVSTSANRSGEAPCRDPKQLTAALLSGIDGLVDGGILPERPPSTLVRIDPGPGTGRVTVVRPGAVTVAAIERVLGQMVRP